MALNPDDFVFHSELLVEQKIKTTTVNVATAGNVNGGQELVWASQWYDTSQKLAYVRGSVYVPGGVAMPNVSNATFKLPVNLVYNEGNFSSFSARIQVQNNRYRAVVSVFNSGSSAIASPNRTFRFTISEYLSEVPA